MGDYRPKRQRGMHGPVPLSKVTRHRLLTRLLYLADAGNVEAAEALVRLSLIAEAQRIGPAASLARETAHG